MIKLRNQRLDTRNGHHLKMDSSKKPIGQSFWMSPEQVAKQLGKSRQTILRLIHSDKIQARQIVENGQKRWKCLLTPAEAQRTNTASLISQWQRDMLNGWLTGKPLMKTTATNYLYGLGLFYKYRRYSLEKLSIDVLNANELALALAKIPHDTKKRNDHHAKKMMMVNGVVSFCRWLEKRGLKKADDSIRKCGHKKRYKQIKKKILFHELLKHIELLENERFKLIAKLFCLTGLRLNEMVNLRKTDILIGRGELLVRHGKGCKERPIGLFPETIPIIKQLTTIVDPAQHQSPWVLHSKTGEQLSPIAIQKLFYRYGKKMGIKISPHDCRHTFACLMDDRGFSIPQIKLALGHENIETTMRYLGVNKARLIAKMASYNQSN